MNTSETRNKSVGQIVAENFSTARIFKNYGIDFCCHGSNSLEEACRAAGVEIETVIEALNSESSSVNGEIPFASWPLDLLIDYILKIHHRGIRKNGPELLALIEKVRNIHGESHPELFELYNLVSESLIDLENHLQKEENVLFPYLLELIEASENNSKIGPMHCGSIANPIRVMHMEHEGEGNRYQHIKEITNNFQAPEDGCNTYRLMMSELETFVANLYEHIHLENNILFPECMKLENWNLGGSYQVCGRLK